MKIRHKGLRALHERDDASRLPAALAPRMRRILFRLQEATYPGGADTPGFRLHPLRVYMSRGGPASMARSSLGSSYLSSCGAMPRVPRANTNFPTMMMAEKVADIILAGS